MDWIGDVLRDVAELPDRNSPADWPEAMLVTAPELRQILETHWPEPTDALLVDIAVGKLLHTYGGLCPDSVTGHGSLDPECPACRAIAAAEAKQADRAPKNNPRPAGG